VAVTDIIRREAIQKALDELSPESLKELADFAAYLRYKEQHDMDWFYKLYDLFAPVREAAAEMNEEEIDHLIDEAVEKARSERKT
jgi:hypothetical protein